MKNIFKVLLLFLPLIANAGDYSITGASGRIDMNLRGVIAPMNMAKVSMCGDKCFHDMTGYDGMYHMKVQPGEYKIYVNDILMSQILVPSEKYFDVAPLIYNSDLGDM